MEDYGSVLPGLASSPATANRPHTSADEAKLSRLLSDTGFRFAQPTQCSRFAQGSDAFSPQYASPFQTGAPQQTLITPPSGPYSHAPPQQPHYNSAADAIVLSPPDISGFSRQPLRRLQQQYSAYPQHQYLQQQQQQQQQQPMMCTLPPGLQAVPDTQQDMPGSGDQENSLQLEGYSHLELQSQKRGKKKSVQPVTEGSRDGKRRKRAAAGANADSSTGATTADADANSKKRTRQKNFTEFETITIVKAAHMAWPDWTGKNAPNHIANSSIERKFQHHLAFYVSKVLTDQGIDPGTFDRPSSTWYNRFYNMEQEFKVLYPKIAELSGAPDWFEAKDDERLNSLIRAHPGTYTKHLTAAGKPAKLLMNSRLLYDAFVNMKKQSAEIKAPQTGALGLTGGYTREINEDIAAEIRATSGPNASRPHACDDTAQEGRDRSFDAPDEQYHDDTDDAKSESGNESQESSEKAEEVVPSSKRYAPKTTRGKAMAATKDFKASLSSASSASHSILEQSRKAQAQRDAEHAQLLQRQQLQDERWDQMQQQSKQWQQEQREHQQQMLGFMQQMVVLAMATTAPGALPSGMLPPMPPAAPSAQPAAQPAAQPTPQPTPQPMAQPTAQPAAQPPAQPSALPLATHPTS